jgi:hypothetical protein
MTRPTLNDQLSRIADKLDAMDGRARDFESTTRVTLAKLEAAVQTGDGRTAALERKVEAQGSELDRIKLAQARGTKVAATAGAGVSAIVATLIEVLSGGPLL